MTLEAESAHFEPIAAYHYAALYAIVDTGRKSFHFYVPAYPMCALQQVGHKFYLFVINYRGDLYTSVVSGRKSDYYRFQWECRVLLLKVFALTDLQ